MYLEECLISGISDDNFVIQFAKKDNSKSFFQSTIHIRFLYKVVPVPKYSSETFIKAKTTRDQDLLITYFINEYNDKMNSIDQANYLCSFYDTNSQ